MQIFSRLRQWKGEDAHVLGVEMHTLPYLWRLDMDVFIDDFYSLMPYLVYVLRAPTGRR